MSPENVVMIYDQHHLIGLYDISLLLLSLAGFPEDVACFGRHKLPVTVHQKTMLYFLSDRLNNTLRTNYTYDGSVGSSYNLVVYIKGKLSCIVTKHHVLL